MKTTKFALPLLLLLTIPSSSEEMESFRDLQWKYARVRIASKEKDEVLRQRFKERALTYPPRAILLRAFKKEALLELWAADTEDKSYVLVNEYRICTSSGILGPKRRFGDEQVPEGFYELDWFNPQSNFFLSLHISYPNTSDRILGSHQNPGGDIFLHGQHLPIHIFPARLTDDGLKALATTHPKQPALIAFWSNLKQGHDLFEKTHRLPIIKTRGDGTYEFVDKITSRGKH